MKKEQITDFIKRYHLGGIIESAAWTFENKGVTTKFRSADKSFMGMVTKENFGVDETCQIGILTTTKLVRLLSILEDEFTFALNKQIAHDEEKIISIKLSDTYYDEENFMLADLTVIPKTKGLKAEPDYDLSIKINDKFIDSFTKAKGALPDTKSFAVVKNNKSNKYQVVIGYSSTNSDSIYIPIEYEELETNNLNRPISFSADYFKEILAANKGAETFKFVVSEQGISHIVVKDNEYSIDYYLAEVQTDV